MTASEDEKTGSDLRWANRYQCTHLTENEGYPLGSVTVGLGGGALINDPALAERNVALHLVGHDIVVFERAVKYFFGISHCDLDSLRIHLRLHLSGEATQCDEQAGICLVLADNTAELIQNLGLKPAILRIHLHDGGWRRNTENSRSGDDVDAAEVSEHGLVGVQPRRRLHVRVGATEHQTRILELAMDARAPPKYWQRSRIGENWREWRYRGQTKFSSRARHGSFLIARLETIIYSTWSLPAGTR